MLLVALYLGGTGEIEAKEVVVLLDPNIRPYVEALAGFKEASDASIKVFERREDGDISDEQALIPGIRARRPDQILVIGGEALAALAGKITDIPILFSMVLSPHDKLKQHYENLTGVAMNVSPERQMKTLDSLMPSVRHVGVVYAPEESGSLIKLGEAALTKHNIEMDAQSALSEKEAEHYLEMVMDRNQAYWMVPDHFMRSKDLVRYLFFASQENNKALIGLSDKYVRAGALFAFTVQNRSLGRQAGELSNRIMNGVKPGSIPIEMARDVDFSINMQVAKALGIQVPGELLQAAKHVY